MKIKKRYKIMGIILILILAVVLLFNILIKTEEPIISDTSVLEIPRLKIADNHYSIEESWINKNSAGLWELYVEGKPFERGVKMGHLSQELMAYQEEAFFNSIADMIPSDKSMDVLKYIIAWQNRNLQDYVPMDLQEEIYGISRFLSDKFDFIGDKFQRKLYYHAAHDIGHTVQNMGLIGCSAFAINGDKSADGNLLIGRNFDFYVGEEFAKHKMLLFVKPDQGIPFMSYSWPGMAGVVSGMNLKGLTVTLNAGPPAIPSSAKMPVSLLARDILQNAATIKEAIKMARKAEVFVSEIFLIGSGSENRSVIIEKSPTNMEVIDVNQDRQICTNHFQSEVLASMDVNESFIEASSTQFRNDKLNSLLNDSIKIDETVAADYLRDWTDLKGHPLGVGNEMSINQMIAHHSIIFKPVTKDVWVSTGDSPMDAYVHYNLDRIFYDQQKIKSHELSEKSGAVPADGWIGSTDFQDYKVYKRLKEKLESAIEHKTKMSQDSLNLMINSNEALYEAYGLIAHYWSQQGDCAQVNIYIDKALKKPIPWKKEREELLSLKNKCLK